jgi:branched-chain amino acid aminotransferase
MALGELASIDGQITATAEAVLPLPDDGLYRGDGVFEVIRLYAGKPFALTEHLDRLERSAAAIELAVERDAVERELVPLLDRVSGEDGQLRIVLTRGGRRILLTEPLPAWPDTVSVATVRYAPSVILTGVKSISYAANMQATRLAKGRGAEEAILVRPDGIVLEAPTSSIFWVSADGGLRTPSISTGILESITRARLVEELQVEEGEFELDDLLASGEAFLASTTREVHGIAAIDGRPLTAPGKRTEEAAEAFSRRVARELAVEAGV